MIIPANRVQRTKTAIKDSTHYVDYSSKNINKNSIFDLRLSKICIILTVFALAAQME